MSAPIPQPTDNPYTQQPPAKKKGGCFKWGAIAGGGLLVLGIVSSLGGGGDTNTSAGSPTTQQQAINNIAATPQHNDVATATQTTDVAATPDVPREFKNALRSAEQYSKLMHMSKAGIYNQLTSEYGEKFSPEAAQYAVDTIKADWRTKTHWKQQRNTKTLWRCLLMQFTTNWSLSTEKNLPPSRRIMPLTTFRNNIGS